MQTKSGEGSGKLYEVTIEPHAGEIFKRHLNDHLDVMVHIFYISEGQPAGKEVTPSRADATIILTDVTESGLVGRTEYGGLGFRVLDNGGGRFREDWLPAGTRYFPFHQEVTRTVANGQRTKSVAEIVKVLYQNRVIYDAQSRAAATGGQA